MKSAKECGAHARSTGKPCIAAALANGRCKNHGGLSTGPKTQQGKQAIGLSNRQRTTHRTKAPATETQAD